jgi:hypothetical protein
MTQQDVIMPADLGTNNISDAPTTYRIRVRGHLGEQWTDWFEGLAVTREESGDTLLAGPISDQAALYRVLRKARDLGMPLISVQRVDACPGGAADIATKG